MNKTGFLKVTPIGAEHYRVFAIDAIAVVFKKDNDSSANTVVRFKDGSQLEVEESIKTIEARLGVQ